MKAKFIKDGKYILEDVNPDDYFFNGYEVPPPLKNIVILIVRRFAITGVCDGMYIANTIALQSGFGDGRGNFSEFNINNPIEAAKAVQHPYGCNILPDEINELAKIIETQKLDKEIAVAGMTAFIKRLKIEKQSCEKWRVDYCNSEIDLLQHYLSEIKELRE